jgi:ABC-type branched-subunit amino acid transport system ATPase component
MTKDSLSFLAEDNFVFPHLMVEDNLGFPAYPRNRKKNSLDVATYPSNNLIVAMIPVPFL